MLELALLLRVWYDDLAGEATIVKGITFDEAFPRCTVDSSCCAVFQGLRL